MKPEDYGHIAADTAAAFNAWVKQYLMPTGRQSGKQIAIHTDYGSPTSK